MYKLILALRYLKARRVTILAIGGTALGVMAFIVVLGVMQGFSKEMRARMRGVLGDLTIKSRMGEFHLPPDLLAELARFENVKAYSEQLLGLALLKIKRSEDEKPTFKYCIFKGVDPERERQVINLDDEDFFEAVTGSLETGDLGENPWLIGGRELLDNPAVPMGSEVVLVVLKEVGGHEFSGPRFRVAGKFTSGMYEFDSKFVYIPLWTAQEMMQSPDILTSITVVLDKPEKLHATRDRLDDFLVSRYSTLKLVEGDVPARQFYVETYEELNQTLFTALKLQTHLATYILIFYFLVAGFVIIAIMTLMVLEKTRDIGITRSLGASASGVLRIFLNYGLAVGVAGAALGGIAGLVMLNRLDAIRQGIVKLTGWDPFPQELYVFEHVPREISPGTLVVILLAAIALGLMAAVCPAIRAARMDPVKTLRYE